MNDAPPILYAEDDDNDIFLMKRAFRRAGLTNRLCVVTNGQEAIEYLSGAGKFSDRNEYPFPGLVLIDLKMPLRSGLEVLQWARSSLEQATPVVVLTSSNQPSDMKAAYENGANAFLVKPGKPDELLALVSSLKQFWSGEPPPAAQV